MEHVHWAVAAAAESLQETGTATLLHHLVVLEKPVLALKLGAVLRTELLGSAWLQWRHVVVRGVGLVELVVDRVPVLCAATAELPEFDAAFHHHTARLDRICAQLAVAALVEVSKLGLLIHRDVAALWGNPESENAILKFIEYKLQKTRRTVLRRKAVNAEEAYLWRKGRVVEWPDRPWSAGGLGLWYRALDGGRMQPPRSVEGALQLGGRCGWITARRSRGAVGSVAPE